MKPNLYHHLYHRTGAIHIYGYSDFTLGYVYVFWDRVCFDSILGYRQYNSNYHEFEDLDWNKRNKKLLIPLGIELE